jgi:hypothetical protein
MMERKNLYNANPSFHLNLNQTQKSLEFEIHSSLPPCKTLPSRKGMPAQRNYRAEMGPGSFNFSFNAHYLCISFRLNSIGLLHQIALICYVAFS